MMGRMGLQAAAIMGGCVKEEKEGRKAVKLKKNKELCQLS